MLQALVVDDDQEIRDALRAVLVDEGYAVAVAHSGAEALAMLRQMPAPVVVLFDYLMPAGDGLHLLASVAEDATLQRGHAYVCLAARPRQMLPAPFIALMDRLDVPFVAKPFDLQTVLTIVDASARRLSAGPP